jgi:ribulose-5-phosphate 4-epimerase/fuculose-1-phosphate aldolase
LPRPFQACDNIERGASILPEEVLEANLDRARRGLALFTFGKASGISRDEGWVVIKASGVPSYFLRADVGSTIS